MNDHWTISKILLRGYMCVKHLSSTSQHAEVLTEYVRHSVGAKKTYMLVTNLDRVLKNRDITLATKIYTVKAMVFPVVMYGRESWTIKKAEHRRIDAFQLWCWRRLLRVPWTARWSKESNVKEINLEYSLEGLMLKLQYFGYLMQRADSWEKILML